MLTTEAQQHTGLPHARGDEPASCALVALMRFVCPTHVGMNRTPASSEAAATCLPHARGDEPPRQIIDILSAGVCPTHVGMNRYPANT